MTEKKLKDDASLNDIWAHMLEQDGWSEDGIFRREFMATGNLGLDFILGGGWPRGRTIELYGDSQSGKTTCAVTAMALGQQRGERWAYIDFEQALDEPYMRALGVDVNDRSTFLPFPATSLETGMEFARRIAATGEVSGIVFDSVPAMKPRATSESYDDQRTEAMTRARLLGAAVSSLNPVLAQSGCSAFFINHIRDVIPIGQGWTPPGPPKKTTPGGTALKFYSSVRCQFTIVSTFKSKVRDPLSGEEDNRPHSVISQVHVTKNKLAAPYQKARLYLELGKGFNDAFTAVQVLLSAEIVKKSGSSLHFPDELYHGQMKPRPQAGGGSITGLQAVLDLAAFDTQWCVALCVLARQVLSGRQLASADQGQVEGIDEYDQNAPSVPPELDAHDITPEEMDGVGNFAPISGPVKFVEKSPS